VRALARRSFDRRPLPTSSTPPSSLTPTPTVAPTPPHPPPKKPSSLKTKQLYFITYYASTAVIQPFFTIFYKTSGYSDVQVGVLAAMRQWTSLPASFLWAAVADAFDLHRIVLLSSIVVAAGLRLSMVWAARAFGLLMAATCLSQVFTAPIAVMTDSMLMSSVKREGDYGRARAWGAAGWGLFTAVAGPLNQRFGYSAGFFFSTALTVPAFLLAMGFRMVSKEAGDGNGGKGGAANGDEENDAGASEACGAADADNTAAEGSTYPTASALHRRASAAEGRRRRAFALASEASTMMAEYNGDGLAAAALSTAMSFPAPKAAGGGDLADELNGGRGGAAVAAAAGAAGAGAGGGAKEGGAAAAGAAAAGQGTSGSGSGSGGGGTGAAKRGGGASTARDAARLFAKPAALLHFWQSILQGYGIALYQSFLFLLLAERGLSPTFMGLTTLVDVVAEVPAFMCMSWLLERVSPGVLIHLSLLGYVLRLGIYATLGSWKYPQLVMLVQLLHGVTYAWGWGAGTIISRRLATPATQATMQGMYQASYLAVGQGTGSVIGGVLSRKFGLPGAFAISSGVMAGGWVLYLVGTILIQVCKCDGREEVASRFNLLQEAKKAKAVAAAEG